MHKERKMSRKIALSVIIAITLIGLLATNVAADTGLQPPTPVVPIDCGVWAIYFL